MNNLFDIMTVMSLMIALPMSYFSEKVILFLFGDSYREASKILELHIWTGIFVFSGVASIQWFLVENLQKLLLSQIIGGAVVKYAINIYLYQNMVLSARLGRY